MKTNLKRTLSAILSTILLLNNTCTISAMATEYETDTSLDTLDTLIAAHIFMASDDPNENYWPDEVRIKRHIPLYSVSGEQVAWYLEFFSGEYAVINNDRNNPSAIEFGEGGNPLICTILDSNVDTHIIYNNPEDICNSDGTAVISNEGNDLYNNYPLLKNNNYELSNLLTTTRNQIQCKYDDSLTRADRFDIFETVELPSGSHSTFSLDTSDVPWVIMDTYESSTIWNHCAATAATNFALYFSCNGYEQMEVNNNPNDTFYAVHSYLLNGPRTSATGVASDISKFVNKYTDYSLYSSVLSTFSSFQTAIRNGRPSMLYLENSLMDAHWVLAVGYRTYTSGNDYMRVVNGWTANANRYYLHNSSNVDLVHILCLWVK